MSDDKVDKIIDDIIPEKIRTFDDLTKVGTCCLTLKADYSHLT